MSSEHIKARNKIKDIASISTFNTLIDSCTLSEEDKELLRMHYLQGKDFRYIGDMLGFSESTIKKRHRKAIQKLSSGAMNITTLRRLSDTENCVDTL